MVEGKLGTPDYASSGNLGGPGEHIIYLVDGGFGVFPGELSIEWDYIDPDYSLLLCFDFGTLRYIKSLETAELRSKSFGLRGNWGMKVVDNALAKKKSTQ